MNDLWAVTKKDDKYRISYTKRLPRKTKKFAKSILDLMPNNYVLMSMSLSRYLNEAIIQNKKVEEL